MDDRTTQLPPGEISKLAGKRLRGGRGGKRPGAGRQRGTIRRLSEEAIREAMANGQLLPLDYMLHVLNDPTAPVERRDAMAIAAAPYMHSKLVRTLVTADGAPLGSSAPMVGKLVVSFGAAAEESKEAGFPTPDGTLVAAVTITPPLAIEGPIIENADRLLAGDGPPGAPGEQSASSRPSRTSPPTFPASSTQRRFGTAGSPRPLGTLRGRTTIMAASIDLALWGPLRVPHAPKRADVEGVLSAAVAGALTLELTVALLLGLGFLQGRDLPLDQEASSQDFRDRSRRNLLVLSMFRGAGGRPAIIGCNSRVMTIFKGKPAFQ
jgi:hypothetical protein